MERLLADVVIVGGGIMGCSAALHLRRRGRSVVLLERGFVGAQASGVNFGNVRRQGRVLSQLPLAMRSREIWGRLGELVGDPCEFRVTGHLRLAFGEPDMAALEEYAVAARGYGLELEVIGRNRLRERWPWLGEAVLGGSWQAADGSANPRLVAPAFARAARALGADIREGHEVAEVGRNGDRFRAVTAAGLEVRAEFLLNTAGAWGHRLAERFGEPVPLVPRAPQQVVTEPAPYFIVPTVGVADGSIYFRQIPRGNVIFGGGTRGVADNVANRSFVVPDNTLAQARKVLGIVPSLESLHIIRVWTGIEGYLPDDIPVIGPSLTTPGLIHAFGFCGHGFQLGPAVGAVLGELVVDGRSATPIAAFTIGRFRSIWTRRPAGSSGDRHEADTT